MVESKLQSEVGKSSVSVTNGNAPSVRDQVRKSVDVLVHVFRLYGFDDTGYSTKGATDWYLSLAENEYGGDWLKLFKDKLASFFAFYIAEFDGVAPQLPVVKAQNARFCPSVLLGSRAYRWMRMFKRAEPLKWRGFITTVLYSKKGFVRPTKEYLVRGEESTFKTLTTSVPEGVRDEPGQSRVSVLKWGDDVRIKNPHLPLTFGQTEFSAVVQRVVEEIFPEGDYKDEDRVRPFFPSTSSNYNNTRSMLGTVGTILSHPTLLNGLRTTNPLVHAHITGGGNYTEVVIDDLELRGRFLELYCRVVDEALVEEPVAVPLALAEALKVRTITKGPPLMGFALKPLQKYLWKTMSKHKTFRFTGEPVTERRLQEVVGILQPGEKWVSADYSDATNSLYSWASDIVCEHVSDRLQLSLAERMLFQRGLTGHILELSSGKGKKKKVQRAPQVRGQLMGSVVSFPVLCIVNAALCLQAYEIQRNQRCKLSGLPLAINGDDAVLRGTDLLLEAWEKMANFVGMAPSVGKVYYSARYLNINSTSYEFHPEGFECYLTEKAAKRESGDSSESKVHFFGEPVAVKEKIEKVQRVQHFELIPYINMGLLYGLTRSGGEQGVDSVGDVYGSLGVRAHALLASCPGDMRMDVYKAYLSRNKERLATSRVPWFTPTYLGGLGLPVLGKFRPNDLDLRVARKIYDHPDKFPVPSAPKESTWLTWKLAQKRFESFPLGIMSQRALSCNSGGSLTTLMGTLCIEALFLRDASSLNPRLHLDGELTDSEREACLKQIPGALKAWKGLRTGALNPTGDDSHGEVCDPAPTNPDNKVREVLDELLAQQKLSHLNALRALNSKVIRDTKIPLPEPFNADHFPVRGHDLGSLTGAYVLAFDLPFRDMTAKTQ